MRPVNPIIRNETPIRIMVDHDRSSMARMRSKLVSLRILKVIADKTCKNINHRISIVTIVDSFLIR